MKKQKTPVLRRYTNLAATIHLLRNREITLLNPGTWDDKNDAHFMAEYKRRKSLNTLLALCFANCPETYHHWKVFSHGSDGVRIEFDRTGLIESFPAKQIVAQNVDYKSLKDLRGLSKFPLDKLPFLKRIGFKDEDEFRIIFQEKKHILESKPFQIKLDCIRRITLSPWMNETLFDAVKHTLKNIDGCSELKVYRSTLTNNGRWQNLASNAS